MDTAWRYEAEHQQDMGGADTFHHVVDGDRHVAEFEREEDAKRVVGDQSWLRVASEFRIRLDGQTFLISRRVYGGQIIPDGLWSACTYYSATNPHYAYWNGDEWELAYKIYTPVSTFRHARSAALLAIETMRERG